MKSVSEELLELLRWNHFCDFHAGCMAELDGGLKRFLTATMDEVRTSTSTRVALLILHIIGLSDAGSFREAVLRRELLGTIAYPRQRDHTSHTLYNYLLGWYFLQYCPKLEAVLTDEFKKRGMPHTTIRPFATIFQYFGCVWQYASLLHDIGYAFEGGLSSIAFEDSIKQAEIGARVAREYFNRQTWLDHDIDVEVKRSQLVNRLGADLRPPPFDKTSSLADIADELRSVGDVANLMHHVEKELNDLKKSLVGRTVDLAKFSGDAFDLWAYHYEFFGNTEMAKRIQSVRKIFNRLIDRGMPNANVRLLDHGVCGGLLQLLASTYHYRLYAAALKVTPPQPQLVEKFLKSAGDWGPAFWWTGIVWGTAAIAVHNVQQIDAAKELDPNWPGPLRLVEDPLTYLGVLVDIIQEWNRYSVFKSLGQEPIQGIEVKLGNKGGKVVVEFTGPHGVSHRDKVRKALAVALSDSHELLEVA